MKTLIGIFVLALALLAVPDRASAETIFGLTTGNQLFTFDSATPGSISAPVPVTGLLPATTLVGIDFRPVDQRLVGVGQVGQAGGTGTVYAIDPQTGAATSINTGFTLTGTAYGVDFNPVPNALRIVSNAGQNLRIVNGGTGTVNTDSALNPGTPSVVGVVGAAYSNNFAGATMTTLFDINNSGPATLVTQGGPNGVPSPNTGQLFPVGSLGVNTTDQVGFDISPNSGVAFASLTPVGAPGSSLYTINLGTGAATLIGTIGNGSVPVQGLTVAVPEPASLGMGVTAALLGLGLGLGCAWRRRRVV